MDSARIVKNPQMWLNGCIAGLMFMPITVFAELWGVEYLKAVKGLTQNDATMGTAMIFLGWAVGGPIVGALSDHWHRRCMPMRLGSLIAGIAMTFVMFFAHSMVAIYSGLFILGLVCSAQVLAFAIGRENCPIYVAATAMVATNFLINFIGGSFQPAIGKVLDMLWKGGTRDAGIYIYRPESYQIAMSVVPLSLFLGCLLTFFLRETYCRQKL